MRGITNTAAATARVATLAARQHGVVSRHQLRGLGLTDAVIDHGLTSAMLHPVFRGVFGYGHPGIDSHGRILAAVLACGERTVTSHGSAAALLGLRDRHPILVDVIARGQAGRKIDGIRAHNVRRPSAHEVVSEAGIPCTSPARTLVDLAGILGSRSLRRTVERAAVLGLLDLQAIDEAMTGSRRGLPRLRAILAEWRSVSTAKQASGHGPERHLRLRSELEARLLALIGMSGLPAPLCNQRVETDGRNYEVDLLWPAQRLVVEVDGRRFHDHRVAFERDRLRDRSLHLGGYRVVRVTATQIETEPQAVIAAIGRLLATR